MIPLPQECWKVKGDKRLQNYRGAECCLHPEAREGLFCSEPGAQCPPLVLVPLKPGAPLSSREVDMGALLWRKAKCNWLARYLGGQKIRTLQLFRKPE